jgi:hypothetical protein
MAARSSGTVPAGSPVPAPPPAPSVGAVGAVGEDLAGLDDLALLRLV